MEKMYTDFTTMKVSLFLLVVGLRYLTGVPASFNLRESMKRNPWQYSGKFEGDMVFSNKRNVLTNSNYRWPNGRVCYYIPPNFPDWQRNMIRSAFANGLAGTCLRPVQCRNCCGGDYVSITNDKQGCYATIGRIGGVQELNLASDCWYEYLIVHEILHSAGFMHQHSATNRDDYVRIFLENVQDVNPDQRHNFRKMASNVVTSFRQPYDYCSLMHYDEFAFSKNGLATIRATRSSNCVIGRATGLSLIDKAKINSMYCNSGS